MSEYKCLYIIIKNLHTKKQNLKILVVKLCYELRSIGCCLLSLLTEEQAYKLLKGIGFINSTLFFKLETL